jgi:hypothetical protein
VQDLPWEAFRDDFLLPGKPVIIVAADAASAAAAVPTNPSSSSRYTTTTRSNSSSSEKNKINDKSERSMSNKNDKSVRSNDFGYGDVASKLVSECGDTKVNVMSDTIETFLKLLEDSGFTVRRACCGCCCCCLKC